MTDKQIDEAREALLTETAQRIYQRLFRLGDHRNDPVPLDCMGIIETELRQALERQRTDHIPSSWLDPLLTGPKAVIGKPPYNCKDIERLLNAIRKRAVSPEDSDD